MIVDPCNEWGNIKVFLQAHQIELKYILLSQASFKNALRVATIQHETGAHFLSFKSDLLPLRKLPRLADEVNVCGIKTPRIDRFLDDLEQIDDHYENTKMLKSKWLTAYEESYWELDDVVGLLSCAEPL